MSGFLMDPKFYLVLAPVVESMVGSLLIFLSAILLSSSFVNI